MKYFAYASNLSLKQMKERCPDSEPLFSATLNHYKLIFIGWSRELRGGKATIRAFRGEKVKGAVYEVSDQCMRKLDTLESGYTRLKVTVFNEDNDPVEAITFINTTRTDEAKPTAEYLTTIQQGYRDWRLR